MHGLDHHVSKTSSPAPPTGGVILEPNSLSVAAAQWKLELPDGGGGT